MDVPDYADRFTADRPPDPRTAEAWMRSALEGAPAAARAFVRFGWRAVLGFRLGPAHSPAHILGWPIAHATPGEIVLRQRSALLTAQLTLRVTGTRLEWTTHVRYDHRAARAIWSVARLVHVLVVPYVLRRVTSRSGPGAPPPPRPPGR